MIKCVKSEQSKKPDFRNGVWNLRSAFSYSIFIRMEISAIQDVIVFIQIMNSGHVGSPKPGVNMY